MGCSFLKHVIIPVLTREDIDSISLPRIDIVNVHEVRYWDFRNQKWASFFIPKAGMQFWLKKMSYYMWPKFLNTQGIATDRTPCVPQTQIGIRPFMLLSYGTSEIHAGDKVLVGKTPFTAISRSEILSDLVFYDDIHDYETAIERLESDELWEMIEEGRTI